MDILLIKQGVAAYVHIENCIEQVAAEIPDTDVRALNLSNIYFSQTSPLREEKNAVRMNRAIAVLLEEIQQDPREHVLLLNGFVLHTYYPAFFEDLRKAGKTITTWQIDDPYYIDKTLPFVDQVDYVMTVDSSTRPIYKEHNKDAVFLPLACHPPLHKNYEDLPPAYVSDVCFIGVPFAGSRRVRLIDELAPCLAKYNSRIMGATSIDSWEKSLAHYDDIKHCIDDTWIKTGDTVRYFVGARINLNIHKDSYGHVWDRNAGRIGALSPCERTFCIAGCGGFQLIDNTRPDLAGLFDIGREVVTFADAPDLADKIDYFLSHDDERGEIARAAQQKAYGSHTYRHRLQAILDIIKTSG